MNVCRGEPAFSAENGRRSYWRIWALALFVPVFFILLAVPAAAAGQSLALPYGELRFESACVEGTVTCGDEALTVYAMTPGPLLKKLGISPDTEITVYYCTVNGTSAQLGGVRFKRDAAYFTGNGFTSSPITSRGRCWGSPP